MRALELILARHVTKTIPQTLRSSVINFSELTIVTKGSFEYFINGKRILLNSGDAIFIPSGSVRERTRSDKTADYISFNYTSGQEFLLPEVIRNALYGEVALLIAAYDKINASEPLDNKEINEHLLACLLSILESRTKSENFNELTQKIIKYIHQNYNRKITLKEIGELTYFSPVYCDTVFKRETGRSIIEYILERRTEEAKNLLLEGHLSMTDVASEVGFADYNYFSRIFKKRTGYTPSSYRQLGRI